MAACGSDDGDGRDPSNDSCSGASFVNSGQTNGGCGDLQTGVAAAADCCEASCGQVCCACSGSAAGYRAALCQDNGTCADAASACQAALDDYPAYCQ